MKELKPFGSTAKYQGSVERSLEARASSMRSGNGISIPGWRTLKQSSYFGDVKANRME